MKALPIVIVFLVFACREQQTPTPNNHAQYREYLRADSLARSKPDSAFYFYYNASENLTDSGYKATALQQMALLQQNAEDYHGSNESALRSIALFNNADPSLHHYLAYNYNLLGSNCLELKRYDDAFQYYDQAIHYADSANISVYRINKGVAYVKTKQYKVAISLFEDILRSPITDTTVYSRVRSNLAKARWLDDPGYPAAGEFHEARHLRELTGDLLGLNASYSHLADFHMKDRPDSARFYSQKMHSVASQLRRADDQAEALEKLAKLNAGSDFNTYFLQYVHLKDSINTARSADRKQFADIRFNFNQAKANNLVLEKDNSDKKFRIARQRAIIYATLAIFIALGISGFFWYNRKKRMQELQTKAIIREAELKTSQKVHDVVANGLYRIMANLEHGEEPAKEMLLDNIEKLYEQSRDISYEKPNIHDQAFSEEIHAVLTSFATESTRVVVAGNQESLWQQLPERARNELKYVLQELMVNMKKHSEAHNVVIRFHGSAKDLTIHYKDDGRGLPASYQKGNGITNTENRIRKVGGTIIFESDPGKGLRVEIIVPLRFS